MRFYRPGEIRAAEAAPVAATVAAPPEMAAMAVVFPLAAAAKAERTAASEWPYH